MLCKIKCFKLQNQYIEVNKDRFNDTITMLDEAYIEKSNTNPWYTDTDITTDKSESFQVKPYLDCIFHIYM